MHILCAGNDLNRLFHAHIHLTDEHVVGVGMSNHGYDLADLDILDLSIHALVGLNLLAKDGQGFNIFLIGYVGQIHEFLIDPISVEFHE